MQHGIAQKCFFQKNPIKPLVEPVSQNCVNFLIAERDLVTQHTASLCAGEPWLAWFHVAWPSCDLNGCHQIPNKFWWEVPHPSLPLVLLHPHFGALWPWTLRQAAGALEACWHGSLSSISSVQCLLSLDWPMPRGLAQPQIEPATSHHTAGLPLLLVRNCASWPGCSPWMPGG